VKNDDYNVNNRHVSPSGRGSRRLQSQQAC